MRRFPTPAAVLGAIVAVGLLLPFPVVAGSTQLGSGSKFGGTALITDAVPIPADAHGTPLAGSTPIRLTLTLTSRDPTGLAEFLQQANSPTSPEYGHFLTESQFRARFGADSGADQQVVAALHQISATQITTTTDGLGISFTTSVRAASGLLGVWFVEVGRVGSTVLYTAAGEPTLPGGWGKVVVGIGGLSNLRSATRAIGLFSHGQVRPLGPYGATEFAYDPTSKTDWFAGSDFTSAYNVTRLFPGPSSVVNATFPSNRSIATILMSGYNDSRSSDTPPWDPVVITQYFNDTFPSNWPKPNETGVPVAVGGVTPPPPGYFNGVNDSSLNEFENSLDLEMAGSLAPGVHLYNFYFAESVLVNAGSSLPLSSVADDFAQCLAAALSYSYGSHPLAAVSNSYGLTDLNDSLWNTELLNAAATGVTVIAASGDQGDAPVQDTGAPQGQWPVWPSSAAFDTFGDTAVGGVTVTLDGTRTTTFNGTSLNLTYDPTVSGIASAVTWYSQTPVAGNWSGSEGGSSTVTPEPSWQRHSAAQPPIVNATVKQGLPALNRAEPDVAFPANNTIAYVFRDVGGIYFTVLAGTSVAAPIFAGMVADWVAVKGHSLGFLTPELYRIASFYAQHNGTPGDPLLDVVAGGNFLFSAAPGWDPTTGWGGVDAVKFLAADGNPSISEWNYTGPSPGLPATPPSPVVPASVLTILIIVGVALAAGIVLVLVFAGRSTRPSPPAPPPYGYDPPSYVRPPPGAYGPPPVGGFPPPPSTPPTSFACPYCGRPRWANTGPCPACGGP